MLRKGRVLDGIVPWTHSGWRRLLSGRQLRGVVFDVDGTLVDSERDGHRVAFNRAFAAYGLPYVWDVATYGELLGVAGGRQRIGHYLRLEGHPDSVVSEWAPELHRLKTKLFEELVLDGEIHLRPGVDALVEELKATGHGLYVATTGQRDWVEPLLARHFDKDTFDLVLTGSEVSELKPSPAIYRTLIKETGGIASGIVAIEDSVNGLRAAQGAGLMCVLVVNDYTVGNVEPAELVVTGFGPGACRISGSQAPLRNGRVRRETLEFIASSPRKPWSV